MWRQCCLPVVLLTGALAVPAQAQVRLQWKLNEGDKFYLETTGTIKQTMKLMGNPIDQQFETTAVDSYKVVKKAADQIVLEKKIESMKVNATGQGAEQAKQSAQKVTGAVFMLTLDPRSNTITKVEGVTEFIKKAFSDDPIMQQAMAATLNDDTLREDQQNILVGFLVDKPVNKGDKWTRKSNMLLGPIGGFSCQGEYVYRGTTAMNNRNLERIDATWSLTYAPPKNKGGLPFEITKGDFKTPTAKGTYYFDADAGKLAQVERKYNMKGTLTMSVAGQDVEMEMEMDQISKVRLLDKAPASE
jgi:hypothetical protein